MPKAISGRALIEGTNTLQKPQVLPRLDLHLLRLAGKCPPLGSVPTFIQTGLGCPHCTWALEHTHISR